MVGDFRFCYWGHYTGTNENINFMSENLYETGMVYRMDDNSKVTIDDMAVEPNNSYRRRNEF